VKKKNQQFRENLTFPFLFQPTFEEIRAGFEMKGHWNPLFFKNDHPIVLELGCGKGEYTVGLAKRNPEKNFIGLDLKGARLWRGCKTVEEEKITNVAFIRTSAEFLEYIFGKAELSELWIAFPEPHPQKAKAKKRFTSPHFHRRYRNILQKEGIIHLKTDHPEFYHYTREQIAKEGHLLLAEYNNLYQEDPDEVVKEIQTFYEQQWLRKGRTISYLRYKLNSECYNRPYCITTNIFTEHFRKLQDDN